MSTYVPDRGDLVWLDFNPQAGHEQAGRRPALIVTPKIYNQRTSLCLACPITTKVKGYPFEVALPGKAAVAGVILADQLKNLDWRVRRAERLGTVDEKTMGSVLDLIMSLIE